jgi:NodT family efflux transporter outer membrane factor (OMF) lipoprotein
MRLSSLLAALALAGCALTGNAPPKPDVDIPAAWSAPALSSATSALSLEWWALFDSAELTALMNAALQGSPDLAIATERVLQAEAQARIGGAALFPALNVDARTTRLESRNNGSGATTRDSTGVTLSASYELDFWGRNSAGAKAANASLAASRFDRDTARLTLVTGVANAYFQLLSTRARLAIARESTSIAERVLKIVEARARNGAASALDVSRQLTQLLSQRAGIPALELLELQTLAALAILAGQPPEVFRVAADSLADLAVPLVAPGMPAQVLTRRPDIAGAEAQLAAANANIAAARAALLPGISLTASAGETSAQLMSVLNGPASALTIGFSLLQPIFDGGRLRGQVSLSEARERELVESYRKAILAALADVENALIAADRTAEQEALQAQVREEAQRVLRLAELRYREGADDLLSVLDAQRTLFQAQDQSSQSRLSRLQASVSLFKALGGGWER